MPSSPSVYVTYIGLKSITLGGDNCGNYKAAIFEIRRGRVVNRFDSEAELNDFLQDCIDRGMPFSDDTKSNAYQEACQLKSSGKVRGVLKSVTWDLRGVALVT